MNRITALFTAIGDLFTGSSWFQYVTWPFWALLFIIAVGGMYTARFKKNTLFCRGIQGALKLALIYMVAIAGYIWIPTYMFTVSQFPFLSVTEETLTLVNPAGLLDRWQTSLPQVLVRLYFLLFLLNAVSTYDYNGKNFLSWCLAQCVSCGVAVFLYEAVIFFITKFWPFPNIWLSYFFGAILALFALVMVFLKFFFLVTKKTGNHTYSLIYQFLTARRFGSLFTASFQSFLVVLGFLFVVNLFGHGRMALANFNASAFCIIAFLTTMALYVFSMFYTERNPA